MQILNSVYNRAITPNQQGLSDLIISVYNKSVQSLFPLWQFLTEDKLNQCQTNLVKVEKELRAERDRCLELEERIQELEAVSATQQSAVRAKQEQVDVLQVSGHQRQMGGWGVGGGGSHEGGVIIIG